MQRIPASRIANQVSPQAGTSSQDEYDETESEEDRVMTSSNEHIQPAASLQRQQTAFRPSADLDSDVDDEDDDDDDENATALGRPSNSPNFQPQPNAFTHPPSHHGHRHAASSSTRQHPPFSHPSMSQRSQPRAHRNFMSPSYQADNDAALRASLTTLLSCAAAARGLPKRDSELAGPSGTGGIGAGVMPSSQPMGLHFVPESELMAEGPPAAASPIPPHLRQPPRTTGSNSSSSGPPSARSSNSSKDRGAGAGAGAAAAAEKSKRPSTPQTRPARAAKKKRTGADGGGGGDAMTATTFISPTVLTWVVSAGVLVLVSVVGFGAGYVIGREVGRQEGGAAAFGGVVGGGGGSANLSSSSSSCGRELAKSSSSGGGTLRRFRWGAVAKSVTT